MKKNPLEYSLNVSPWIWIQVGRPCRTCARTTPADFWRNQPEARIQSSPQSSRSGRGTFASWDKDATLLKTSVFGGRRAAWVCWGAVPAAAAPAWWCSPPSRTVPARWGRESASAAPPLQKMHLISITKKKLGIYRGRPLRPACTSAQRALCRGGRWARAALCRWARVPQALVRSAAAVSSRRCGIWRAARWSQNWRRRSAVPPNSAAESISRSTWRTSAPVPISPCSPQTKTRAAAAISTALWSQRLIRCSRDEFAALWKLITAF